MGAPPPGRDTAPRWIRGKRKTRLVVALTCALLPAGALATRASRPRARRASPASCRRRAGRDLPADRRGREGQLEARGHDAYVPGRGPQAAAAPSVPVRYVGQVRTRSARGARSSIDVRKQGGMFEGQPDSLVTKCPSKFTAEPKTQPEPWRSPVPYASPPRWRSALRDRRVALRGARGTARLVASGRRAVYALAGALRSRWRSAGGVRALGLLLRAGRDPLVHDDAAVLPAHRRVVLAGGLAAAVGAAARALEQRDPVPHAQPAARGRALRDRGAARLRRLLLRAARFLESPFTRWRRRRPRAPA